MFILKNRCCAASALIITLFFMLADNSAALEHNPDRPWYIPDLISVQTAGYIGYAAGGIGYLCFHRFWESTLFYGYVPEEIGGREIHTLSWKNSIYPIRIAVGEICELSPLYLGTTFLFALDKSVHWQYSTDCPDWYYPPTGFHVALNIGIQVLIKSQLFQIIHGFYAEITMLDTYMKAYFWDDHEHLAFNDCATLALGYKIIF
ncbi:MAG TPA: hypothetical protein PK253_06510 [Spirochaetota bacterium]|nr:hypothetical protein [Spirochaetota bacterium]